MAAPITPRRSLAIVPRLPALALAVLGLLAARAPAADPTEAVKPAWPPKGEPLKVSIARDTWISFFGQEQKGSNGGASQLKFKGQGEYSLIDVDPAALKGKIITGALLHLRCNTRDWPLRRITASTIASPWEEGTGTSYAAQEGASCFLYARYSADATKAVAWTFPGSTFMDATYGLSHTIWRFADATPPDQDGWQTVAVSADVVAARVAGLSYGLALYDDVGNEWSYKDGKFTWDVFPNRFAASREQSNAQPYLEVWVAGTDTQPPAPVAEQGFAVETKGFPAGEALVTWKTPADQGGGKTLGFNVTYKAGEGPAKPMPRYLIPMAAAAGKPVRMHVQDVPFKVGQEIELTIQAVDSAGNVSQPFTKTIEPSKHPAVFAIEPADVQPFEPSENLPEVGGLKVAVIDLVDKVEAKTGKMVPDHPAGYKGGNHLWSAAKKTIRLYAARNEHVCFQVNLAGESPAAVLGLTFDGDDALRTGLYRLDYVSTGAGLMPDAAVPLRGPLAIPFKGDPEAAEQTNASVLCEVYVPHEAKAGVKKGELRIASQGQTLQIPVELHVWNFTLPNKLSFVPEMNAYGTVTPEGQGLMYYRLAHEHRTCINRLPYVWSGAAQLAPTWDGQKFDFTEWDRQFGPLLSGQAFANMPRKGEPLDAFYLPFNESWPVNIHKHYKPAYWVEEAFDAAYKDEMKRAFAAFAKHLAERKWHNTMFQFYLNNKVYYKDRGWEASAAPWIFDEPVNTQDFWALRWYGILWHQAVDPVKGDVKAWYRCDISRSDFGRDMLWGVMDIDYFGGSSDHKARQKHDEQALWTHTYFAEYGGANDPGSPNIQPVVWCLLAWSRGATGVLPWQTIGENAGVWSKGESTCVFYPPKDAGGPVASIRLKAFRQGQQDVEYLTLLGDAHGQPQFAVAAGLRQMIDLGGRVIKRSEEDAGIIQFDKADPVSLWKVRTSMGKMLDAKKPEYKRAVRVLASPPTDMNALPAIGYVEVAPPVEAAKPEFQK